MLFKVIRAVINIPYILIGRKLKFVSDDEAEKFITELDGLSERMDKVRKEKFEKAKGRWNKKRVS